MAAKAGATEIRAAEDLTRTLFGLPEAFDVLLFQAEAIALLEAAVKALAVPGQPAASVLTSIYGDDMNMWFEASGCPVVRLDLLGQDRGATIEEVERMLDSRDGISALSVVQGEALTGVVNPVDEIAAITAERGIALLVDSVSSVGAEPFTPQRWGSSISIIGAQKALGGPSGLSIAIVDARLWERFESNPGAPRRSFLSLLDLKHNWLDTGREAFIGMPSAEELAALLAALRVATGFGIETIEGRHRDAQLIARRTVSEIPGIRLTVDDADASALSTGFRLIDPALDRARLLGALADTGTREIQTAPDPRNLRWMHCGEDAHPERVRLACGNLATAVAGQLRTAGGFTGALRS